jgi:hypothetical protein
MTDILENISLGFILVLLSIGLLVKFRVLKPERW